MSPRIPIGSPGKRDSNGEPSSSLNTLSRRIRPPPINTSSLGDGRVPLGGEKVQRKESKSGLRGMFSRNKTEKNAVSTVFEENKPTSPLTSPTPLSPKLMSPITSPVGDRLFRKFSTSNATDSSSPTTPLPGRALKTSSRLNLRSKSAKDSKPAIKPEPKTGLKTSAFEPPPLFQSYPQSIKHGRLSASTLSADAIIRTSNHNRNTSLRDEIAQKTETGQDHGMSENKTTTQHQRQNSGSMSKGEWTEKIFVLVTSGYLLQYSGEGNFDRLPEKMIQLGKESVAFASDVIPGKHWVLQVSQSMSADGVPTSDSKSLLSRITFRSADYRRNAASLLLVLDSAEEMDSWIAVLRKEIESLGGKKQTTEIGTIKTEEETPEWKSPPSHRYPIQRRGSEQISNPCSPLQSRYDRRPSWQTERQFTKGLALPWSSHYARRSSWQKPEEQNIEEISSPGFLAPWSLNEAQKEAAARPSTGCASVTNSTSSYDHNLEGLRDSINRLSHCSSDRRTRISSPATSPARDSTSTVEDLPPSSLEAARARPNAAEIVERRRSVQALQGFRDPIPRVSSYHLQTSQQTLRLSNYGVDSRPVRSPSPAAPKFSVPDYSSRRFLTRSPVTERRPSLPTLNTTMETQKRSKVGPPIALSVPRSLSPVLDTISTKRIPVATSTETSYRPALLSKSSAVDCQSGPPGISTGTRPSKGLTRSRRVLDFMQLDNELEENTDLRRHSSMQTGRQIPPSMVSNRSFESCEALSPKTSHDEVLDNIRENVWDSLPEFQESSLQARPLSTLPEIPPKQSSLGRPRSMLASSSLKPPTTENLSSTLRRNRPSSTLAATTISPTIRSLTPGSKASNNLDLGSKVVRSEKGVSHRTMPVFSRGAAPTPPPTCPLPPLPPGAPMIKNLGPFFGNPKRKIAVPI